MGTNYDRLGHIANYDSLVRELLGVKEEFGKVKKQYSTTSLKENIRYIDDSFLVEVNELIVKAGHSLVKKRWDKNRARTNQSQNR